MWMVVVIVTGCVCLMISLGFLGAALDRYRARQDQVEATRRVLEQVRAGRH